MNPSDVVTSQITSWRAGVEYRAGGPLPKFDFIAATGGPNSNDNAVGFREHKNAAYHGLRVIPGVGPYPITEHFYTRAFGTGVRHRGAAVAIQITASANYTAPVIVAHR